MRVIIKDAATGIEGTPFDMDGGFPRTGEVVAMGTTRFRVHEVEWDMRGGTGTVVLSCGEILGEES